MADGENGAASGVVVNGSVVPNRSESYLEVAADGDKTAVGEVRVSVPGDFGADDGVNESAGPSRAGSEVSVQSLSDAQARKMSHVAPLEQASVSLTWQDLRYTVPVKTRVDGKKTTVAKPILSNLTGAVKPGEMMCVMGTSGSGKTSFLNVLAGRHDTNGQVTGTVLCNGAKRSGSYKRTIAFVSQDDLLYPNLTVMEMLTFTALLRLPRDLPRKVKLQRAEEVVDQLGLSDCENTRIGSEIRRGISGGERKRTSIGVELITNPRLLFLDEPTSGLDAYTAHHVMQTIKTLCFTGRSVICSIHQPRNKIYELFDKVLLLAKGETCYFGPRADCRLFLNSIGHECPPAENLADFMLDITTIDPRTPELLSATTSTVKAIEDAYDKSQYRADAVAEVKGCGKPGGCDSDVSGSTESLGPKRKWNLTWLEEYWILLRRSWKLIVREPKTTKAAFGQAVFMGLLVGIVFFGLDDDQTGIRDRQGVLFFAVLGNAFPALSACLLLFHAEKKVFNRERIGGAYRVSSYFLAKSTTDIPVLVAPMFVYVVIMYFMVGLVPTAEAFFKTTLMLIFVVITAQSYGSLISAATSSIQVAQAVGPLSMILLILFGGFYLQVDSIPVWLKWVEVFSFLQYAFVGLVHVQFEGQTFSCDQANYCLRTGDDVLREMGIDSPDRGYWHEFGKVVALAVGFRFLAYLALRFMHKKTLHFD